MGKLSWVVLAGSTLLALGVVRLTSPQELPNADDQDPIAVTGPTDGSRLAAPLAPDFALGNLDAETVRLSDFAGRVRLLNFWATWCGPCRLEMPHLQDLYETYRERGLTVIGISIDQGSTSAVREFVRKMGVTYPVVIGDRQVREDYGRVSAIPTSFLVDRNGRVRRFFVGYRDKSVLEPEIQRLLGESGGPRETRSVGSNLKGDSP